MICPSCNRDTGIGDPYRGQRVCRICGATLPDDPTKNAQVWEESTKLMPEKPAEEPAKIETPEMPYEDVVMDVAKSYSHRQKHRKWKFW